MKLNLTLLIATLVIASVPAFAQPKHTPSAAHSATSPAATHGCVSVGDISAKIPALRAGNCPKALYTLSRIPSIKMDYVSPMTNLAALRDTFQLNPVTITLAYADIQTGNGAIVVPGKFLSMLYTGYLADGTVFDSSAQHGNEPIVIQYGKHGVIPGWDTGLDGMRVGGKRRLYIPYELAYGANGQPPTIPAKAELIFDVEFVSQNDTRPVAVSGPVTAPAKMPPPTKPTAAPPAQPAPVAPASTPPAATSKPQ